MHNEKIKMPTDRGRVVCCKNLEPQPLEQMKQKTLDHKIDRERCASNALGVSR